jgi:hypothetical protein
MNALFDANPDLNRGQHGNPDPNPDRLQNNADPKHCLVDKRSAVRLRLLVSL